MNTMNLSINPLAAALAAALCVLAGCAVVEPRTQPTIELPPAFVEPQPANTADVSRDWWLGFNSPELTRLIDESLAGSSDLRIAAERITQAEIALRAAGASLLPTVGAGAGQSFNRSDSSGSDATTRRGTSLSVSVSYELDLWGRIAAGIESQKQSVLISRYDLETVRLSLTTGVAATYFQLLATRTRLDIAHDNLATAERVLRVAEARLRNGVATPLEVSQQTTTVLNQRTALIPLEVAVRQTTSALALLLGRVPQGFAANSEGFDRIEVPVVAAGLPSTLLTRRPDLAAAEAQLAAADANVAAARAALLPSISLSASGGVSSAALLSLANPTNTLSLGLSLAQSLFDGGQRRAVIESEQSQRRVLVESYGQAVRIALKEVDDGLGNADRSARQEASQRQTVEQARRVLRLAELLYREGTGDLLAVLDAQRSLFSAQDQLTQLRLTRLTSALDLYKALGGGWVAPNASARATP
jgi:NodT family efflux transporter outer membrane factor (OMF) lipoprotein